MAAAREERQFRGYRASLPNSRAFEASTAALVRQYCGQAFRLQFFGAKMSEAQTSILWSPVQVKNHGARGEYRWMGY